MADKYEVIVGLNYPPDQRAEPGEIRDDIPKESVPWLLSGGLIRKVKSKTKPKEARADGILS